VVLHQRHPLTLDDWPEIVQFLLHHCQKLIYDREGHSSLLSVLQNAFYSVVEHDNEDEEAEAHDDEEQEEQEDAEEGTTRFVVKIPTGTLEMDQLLELLAYFVSQDPGAIRAQNQTNRELAIHVACRTHAPIQVLRFLVDQDPVTLQVSDATGSLPIHAACRAGAPLETLQFLVEAPGSAGKLYARDHNGALPLHLLCQAHPPLEAIKYLLQFHLKSSLSIKTNDGDICPSWSL